MNGNKCVNECNQLNNGSISMAINLKNTQLNIKNINTSLVKQQTPKIINSTSTPIVNGSNKCDFVPSWRRKLSSENCEPPKVIHGKLAPKKCQTRDRSASLPLVSILKTSNISDIMKFRPRAKSLGFKEGDPLIIGEYKQVLTFAIIIQLRN